MKQNFEITSQGIKFNFRRFLSDTSIGLILLFLISDKIYNTYYNYINNEIVFYTILFILSTPIGLLINISSWILLGFFQKFLSRKLFLEVNKTYLLYSTFVNFNIIELRRIFKLNKNNFFIIIFTLEKYLNLFYPDKISYYDNLIGMRIFYRNISLVSIIYFIYYSLNYDFKIHYLWFLVTFLFFLLANVVITIYSFAYILYTFFLLEGNISFNSLEEFLKQKKINKKESKIIL